MTTFPIQPPNTLITPGTIDQIQIQSSSSSFSHTYIGGEVEDIRRSSRVNPLEEVDQRLASTSDRGIDNTGSSSGVHLELDSAHWQTNRSFESAIPDPSQTLNLRPPEFRRLLSGASEQSSTYSTGTSSPTGSQSVTPDVSNRMESAAEFPFRQGNSPHGHKGLHYSNGKTTIIYNPAVLKQITPHYVLTTPLDAHYLDNHIKLPPPPPKHLSTPSAPPSRPTSYPASHTRSPHSNHSHPPNIATTDSSRPPLVSQTSTDLTSKGRKRKRLAKACSACHKNKRRCDGFAPCSNW